MKKFLLTLVGIICSLGIAFADTYEWSHDGQKKTLSVTAAKSGGSASTYSSYSISYGGDTYKSCIKMESATTLTFTTTNTATITVGVALKSGKAYSNAAATGLSLTTDGGDAVTANTGITSETTGAATENGLEVVFSNVAAGTQVIKRASAEEGVFYIKVEEQNASQVVKPTIKPTWGDSYGDATTVEITSATDGASIYYTLDGTTPTASSTAYTAAFTVTSACTVKAIAIKSGLTDSEVASQAVTINDQRKINYDFSAVELTQGSAIASTTRANNATYTLPNGRMYYIDGKTQTGWSDGTTTYDLGASVTIDKDYTFTPVFADNTVALGDAAATVNWTFATKDGAPSAGLEGKIGYYAAQTTVNGTKLDAVMKINTVAKAAGDSYTSNGKWNTTSADNRAQVNKGTVFTIPAIAGMVVTYTKTNGTITTESATFAGEAGTVSDDANSLVYTYNGTAETIDIVDEGSNLYPSGLSVVYPYVSNKTASDLAVTYTDSQITLPNTTDITYTTSSTGTVTVKSSAEAVATATVNTETKTITITSVAAGTATITVSQAEDDTYAVGTATINVTVKDPYAGTVVYDLATGVGSQEVGNSEKVILSDAGTSSCSVKFTSSLTTASDKNTNYLKITPASGTFKAGDVISFTGYYNKDTETPSAVTIYKNSIEDGNCVLEASEQFANIHKNFGETATSQSFTLTSDADALFIGRNGGTTTYLYGELTVTRPATVAFGTVNNYGYSTFSSNKNVLIEGAQAYTAELDGTTVKCHKIVSNIVPAYTGVILISDANTEYTALYQETAGALAVKNDLKATTTAEGTAVVESSLVLSGDTFVTFTGSAFIAGKAYLPYKSGAKTLTITFDNATTAINAVETVNAVKNAAYNIAGQRVNANAKGLVIMNGKKYINK